jgi:sulfate adenylyltransferase subunit 2
MAHLAKKAFWPAKLPFQLMHVDTGTTFRRRWSFAISMSPSWVQS